MATRSVSKLDIAKFSQPDEVRTFEKGKVEILDIGGTKITRFTLEPGWRWSEHVKPVVNTEWCMVPHFQYVVSGKISGKMKNGEPIEARAGDVVYIPPEHDGWVVGNEPCVLLDWGGGDYAKP